MHDSRLISDARYKVRMQFWEPVKLALQAYCQASKNNASKVAKAIGVANSQIHRFSCPVCEHEQVPDFPTGMAIVVYLASVKMAEKTTIQEPNSAELEKANQERKAWWRAYNKKRNSLIRPHNRHIKHTKRAMEKIPIKERTNSNWKVLQACMKILRTKVT